MVHTGAMTPPGAVVTLLFTDIVGSTELLSRLGDDAFEGVRRLHFRTLGEVVTGYRPSGRPAPAGLRAEGPLVGRDRELAVLEDLLKSVLAEGCQLALVAGDAGIGKTRLAAELAVRAHDASTVLYGRCDS